MGPLKASVIIPAFNAAQTLDRCLAALNAQTMPRGEYEIIVVDDGSTDDTATVASRYSVRYLKQRHRGPSAARNLGIANARGEIVLFTDSDTEPTPNWIEMMLVPFADQSVAGAKGTYRTRQREWMARFVQIEYEEKYARMSRARTVDVIDTYSAAYRREAALFDGGFDESYPSASVEDAEFSFRLAKHGYRLVFNPDAIVFHQHATSLPAYCRRKFNIGYWRVRVHERHPDKIVSDAHTPPTQKLQVILVPLVVFTGLMGAVLPQGWIAFGVMLVLFGLSALPLTWRALRKDPVIGLVTPIFVVFRALSLSLGLAAGLMVESLRRLSASGVFDK